MKKRNKSILSIALALVMVFSMFGATAFAVEDNDPTITFTVLDTPDGYYGLSDGPYEMVATEGSTLMEAIDAYFGPNGSIADYGAVWEPRYDDIAEELAYALTSFIGCDYTNDYYYELLGESGGWGWMFTINGGIPYFTAANPVHLMAASQYVLQPGDVVEYTYTYTTSEWVDYDYLSITVWDAKSGDILETYTYGARP
jgi:hypothetical protein